MIFTDDQMGLLTRLFSEGIQRAEVSLKEVMGGRGAVKEWLEKPELLPLHRIMERQRAFIQEDACCGAYVDFSGPFSGRTVLICGRDEGNPLVDKLFGRVFEKDIPTHVYEAMRPEAMCELGNLLLNACISSFSMLFNCEIETSIPEPLAADPHDVLGIRKTGQAEILALFMPLQLTLDDLDASVVFIFEVFSLHSLVIALEARLEKDRYGKVADDRSPDANYL